MHLSKEDPANDTMNSDDTLPPTNPYNNDMRDRMIKHELKIKFIKTRYTTPADVEFSSPHKSRDNTFFYTNNLVNFVCLET